MEMLYGRLCAVMLRRRSSRGMRSSLLEKASQILLLFCAGKFRFLCKDVLVQCLEESGVLLSCREGLMRSVGSIGRKTEMDVGAVDSVSLAG